MKERVEDLGKLSILLEQIEDNKLFDFVEKKYFIGQFVADEGVSMVLEEDPDFDNLWQNIQAIHSKIYECLEIAKGEMKENEKR